MKNCVLIIMFTKFEPIWIYLHTGFISVHVGCVSCSYKCAFFILVNWPHLRLLNNIHMTSYEFNILVDLRNISSTPLPNHYVSHNFFLIEISNVVMLLKFVSFCNWNGWKHVSWYLSCAHDMNTSPSFQKNVDSLYFWAFVSFV